jgi:hypothetical protein
MSRRDDDLAYGEYNDQGGQEGDRGLIGDMGRRFGFGKKEVSTGISSSNAMLSLHALCPPACSIPGTAPPRLSKRQPGLVLHQPCPFSFSTVHRLVSREASFPNQNPNLAYTEYPASVFILTPRRRYVVLQETP